MAPLKFGAGLYALPLEDAGRLMLVSHTVAKGHAPVAAVSREAGIVCVLEGQVWKVPLGLQKGGGPCAHHHVAK
jgi:hypothetical protein